MKNEKQKENDELKRLVPMRMAKMLKMLLRKQDNYLSSVNQKRDSFRKISEEVSISSGLATPLKCSETGIHTF